VKQVKRRRDLDAWICFLQPPNVEELEKRLRGRGTENEESMQKEVKADRERDGVCADRGERGSGYSVPGDYGWGKVWEKRVS
jgi:hypothetical protein